MRILTFISILLFCTSAFAMGTQPPRPTYEDQVQRCVDVYELDLSDCAEIKFPENIWLLSESKAQCKQAKCEERVTYDRCVEDAKNACQCNPWFGASAECNQCHETAGENC